MAKLKVCIEDAEIRGCERRANKKGEDYLLVRFEDENGRANELVDKVVDREACYKRGTQGKLVIEVDQGAKYTSIRIVDFLIK